MAVMRWRWVTGGRVGALVSSLVVGCAPSLDLDQRDTPGAGDELGCRGALAPHDIQGLGGASPREGQRLAVTGVVALEQRQAGQPSGFFLQSLVADAIDQSSEGVFVAFPPPAPAPGTAVTVVGVVAEHAGETRLDAVERIEACGRAPLVPLVVEADELDAPERLEHMLVEARADWTVLDVPFAPLRSSAVSLSPRGRAFAPGHELGAAPPTRGGVAGTYRAAWRLELASDEMRVDSIPRRGSRLPSLAGVVRVPAGAPRLVVSAAPDWAAPAPPAPARPRPGGLRVVALNCHDYYVDLRARGARSEPELQRQRDKLAALLLALDADVLALTELQNVGARSLEHLLEGLAAGSSESQPAYVFTEEVPKPGNELRAGIAYRPGRARPLGPAWFEPRAGFRRAPLFQSFQTTGGSLTIGVVHFKSKLCGDEPTFVPAGGCGEDTRRAEAELLLDSLRSQREHQPLEPQLIMGDLNSDPLEAAPLTLQQGGLVDLLAALPSEDRYSFIHEGRASLLDHAFGSADLAARLRGAAIWHINADEPALRDYSLDNPPEAYAADARRASDHDPVVVDLDF